MAEFNQKRNEIIPLKLEDGTIIHVTATNLGGDEYVSFKGISNFEDLAKPIEQVSKSFAQIFQKVKPSKATIEFGLEISIESGNLTALIVKGDSTASINVTLEWNNS